MSATSCGASLLLFSFMRAFPHSTLLMWRYFYVMNEHLWLTKKTTYNWDTCAYKNVTCGPLPIHLWSTFNHMDLPPKYNTSTFSRWPFPQCQDNIPMKKYNHTYLSILWHHFFIVTTTTLALGIINMSCHRMHYLVNAYFGPLSIKH